MIEETTTSVRQRRFLLQRRLGSGAFGEVYLAELDTGAGFRRKVALKVLHPEVAESSEAVRRMRDEARLLGLLAHRNIVGVLDLVELDERWAVVMDYVPGADLDAIGRVLWDRGQRFPLKATFQIGVCIARALDAAYHAADGTSRPLRVVHRDIKPANVRMTADGELKVLDFGVASASFDTREATTRARMLIGTERYMAPERLLRQGDTHAGDVYATAATLAELILMEPIGTTPLGDEPHARFVEGIVNRLGRAVEHTPDVADDVRAVFGACLHADPSERPTAAELVDRLAAIHRALDDRALEEFATAVIPEVERVLGPVGDEVEGMLLERSSASIPVEATFLPPPDEPEPDEGSRLHKVAGYIAVAASILLLLAAGMLLAQWTQPAPEPRPTVAAPAPSTPVPAPPPATPAPTPPPATPAPATPTPPPKSTPTPTKVRERKPTPAPAPTPPPVATRTIDRALVSVADASSLSVTCGGVTATGTASARIRNFPAGRCTVEAVHLGKPVRTTVTLDAPTGVSCTVRDGSLQCN